VDGRDRVQEPLVRRPFEHGVADVDLEQAKPERSANRRRRVAAGNDPAQEVDPVLPGHFRERREAEGGGVWGHRALRLRRGRAVASTVSAGVRRKGHRP